MTPLWRDYFPHQTFLPWRPELVEEQPVDGRIPGLVDESN